MVQAVLIAGLVLASQGQAAVRVALPAQASPAERTAARELVEHLARSSGARFEIVEEGLLEPGEPAIHVGPTQLARTTPEPPRGPEQWRIRTVGESLVLDGGRPRGTLYAVYQFLERVVGVRWWTPYDTAVPQRPELVLGALALEGRPVFEYRDVFGLDGPVEFSARNRHSGGASRLGPEHGGCDAYGPPHHVHTFYLYVPPEEHFAKHPEYFSEIDGRRTAERAQLCLSNAELPALVAERLAAYADASAADSRAAGREPPRLFGISPNDWKGGCSCARCSAIDRRAGSAAGSLVAFLNAVARRATTSHPDLRIDTLAYLHTFEPPRGMTLAGNAVVRLSALQRRDFGKPVTHRTHRSYRAAIDGWRAVTPHLRIWDYSVTFGPAAELPLPNLRLLAEDFRYYREHGIEGLYVQHGGGSVVRTDMRDLKVWVLLKLLEDPYRDVDGLVHEFTTGYYGAAGAAIRAYLQLLERALARHAPEIDYPARAAQYSHLTPAVLLQAHALFDEAEAAVAAEPALLERVRFARLALDRASLMRWSGRLRMLDPQAISRRYWSTAKHVIESRVPPELRDAEYEAVADEIVPVLLELGYKPPSSG